MHFFNSIKRDILLVLYAPVIILFFRSFKPEPLGFGDSF